MTIGNENVLNAPLLDEAYAPIFDDNYFRAPAEKHQCRRLLPDRKCKKKVRWEDETTLCECGSRILKQHKHLHTDSFSHQWNMMQAFDNLKVLSGST